MLNKIKWIAGLLIVFVLIISTNLLDRREFKTIKQAVTNIYEDRMVTQDLIFKITLLLEEKSIALASSDAAFFVSKNNKINTEIVQHVKEFRTTNLTDEETKNLTDFQSHLEDLIKLEPQFTDSNSASLSRQTRQVLADPVADLKQELYELSKIQMQEGERELKYATKSADRVSSVATVEIGFLVIIGLIIQFIILYPPKKEIVD